MYVCRAEVSLARRAPRALDAWLGIPETPPASQIGGVLTRPLNLGPLDAWIAGAVRKRAEGDENMAFLQFLRFPRAAAFVIKGVLRVALVSGFLTCVSAGLFAGPADAVGEPKLLLLPIVVHSAEDPAYLREGLNDMLTARLARIGSLDLIQPDGKAAELGTSQLEKARALGQKAGADFVLFGSFTRFGQGASLDVQCVPISQGRSAEPLREIFVHSGSIGEIIPDLDDLAGKVSRFARGELIPSTTAGAAAAALPAAELQNLKGRVAALEAALSRLAKNAEDDGATDGTTGELR